MKKIIKKTVKWYLIFNVVVLVLGGICGAINYYSMTPAERVAFDKQCEADRQAAAEKKYIKDLNNKCSGVLCTFESYLKDNMRDPDSFEVIKDDCVYNDKRGCYVADVTYRSKNGFGGYAIERVMCDITPNNDTYDYGKVVLLYRQ